MSKLVLLEHNEINLKLDRIAWQIAEEYFSEKKIAIIGLKSRGYRVASLIYNKLVGISEAQIELFELDIDKSNALLSDVKWDKSPKLKSKAVVLVDDVLNSGITLAGAMKHILNEEPKRLKVAVLANRDHKAFPIAADFVGVSLATTLKEHIAFVEAKGKMTVYLD